MVKKTRCFDLKDLYMVLNNLPDLGTLDFITSLLYLVYLWFLRPIAYVKRTTGDCVSYPLYVANILLAGNNLKMIKATKQWLSFVFDTKDMGELRFVLRVNKIKNHPKKLPVM